MLGPARGRCKQVAILRKVKGMDGTFMTTEHGALLALLDIPNANDAVRSACCGQLSIRVESERLIHKASTLLVGGVRCRHMQ